MTETIGSRIKRYEESSNHSLLPKCPVFIRVDGKAFHSFTKKMKKPFDKKLRNAMIVAAQKTIEEMMNFKLGYHQSDEFTFLLIDTNKHETQPWLSNRAQKICSITAGLFTAHFNQAMNGTTASFDARTFNCPLQDVPNVFIWRQRDWERNSLQMFARSFFSHKQLENKGKEEIHEMLHIIGKNWSKLDDIWKDGTFLTKKKQINKKMNYEELREIINHEILDNN